MNLSDCTKQELIRIIEQYKPANLDELLEEFRRERQRQKVTETKRIADLIVKLEQEQAILMAPYANVKSLFEVPTDVLKKQQALALETQEARRKLAVLQRE